MSSKREREYERRRLERWQERQAKARASRRRRNVVGGAIAGVVVVIAAIAIAVAVSDKSPAATPTSTPTASATATATGAALDLSPRTGNGGKVPDKSLAQNRTWTATITTNRGAITAELYGDKAPQAVANFVTLAQQGYFDQTKCHRLVTTGIHVLQCGDPTATGTGGPGYSWGPIENAPADGTYAQGTLAMARQSGNGSSMGSQFFLTYADSQIPADSAGGYTVFGKITSGLDVLQAIAGEGTVQVSQDLTAPVHDVIIEGVKTQ